MESKTSFYGLLVYYDCLATFLGEEYDDELFCEIVEEKTGLKLYHLPFGHDICFLLGMNVEEGEGKETKTKVKELLAKHPTLESTCCSFCDNHQKIFMTVSLED